MPPLSTLDMHEARGLPRSTLRDECFQRYDRPEGIPRHFSQEYNTSTALEQAEMPDGKIDERSPDMYAHRRGASGHSRSLRSLRSLKGLTIKHTARGLDQKLSPTQSTGQISAQWARVYAHGMPAGMLRPTLTASRDVTPRGNSRNVFNLKGHIDISRTSTVFECSPSPHAKLRRSASDPLPLCRAASDPLPLCRGSLYQRAESGPETWRSLKDVRICNT